jgi:hypothetical protein
VALAAGRELEAALAVPRHQVLVFQGGEEGVQVQILGEMALLLEVAHPLHGLVDVAAGGQDELVEQPEQVEPGEDLLNQLGVQIDVLMPHDVIPRSVDVPAPAPSASASPVGLQELELDHLLVAHLAVQVLAGELQVLVETL